MGVDNEREGRIGTAAWLLRDGDGSSAVATTLGDNSQPILWAAGGTTLVAGGTLGILTLREQSAYSDDYRVSSSSPDVFADRNDRGETLALWTNVLLATGLTLTSLAVVDLFFFDEPEPAETLP